MTNGTKTTDLPLLSQVEDLIGHDENATGRIPLDVLRGIQAQNMLTDGPLADALAALQGQITGGMLAPATWSDLQTLTGSEDNAGAEVPDSDAGTHAQATATGYDGASVANGGRYRWVAAWSRWERVGDTAASGKADVGHGHAISEIVALQEALDDKAADEHTHNKADVGLGQADDTADVDKPVSSPQRAAVDRAEFDQGVIGSRLDDWTSDLTGDTADCAVIPGAAMVDNTSFGPVLNVTGTLITSGDHIDVGDRRPRRVDAGRLYQYRVRYLRSSDPTDPLGATIDVALKNLTSTKSHFSDVTPQSSAPTVADGVQEVQFTVSKDASLNPDHLINASVVYQRLYLKIFDADPANIVQVIDVEREDITDRNPADLVALQAQIDAKADVGVEAGFFAVRDPEVKLANFTGSATGTGSAAVNAAVSEAVVDGFPVFQITGLETGVKMTIAEIATIEAPEANTTYRGIVLARLQDVQDVGSNQAQIRLSPLDADLDTSTHTSQVISLTTDWQVFFVEHTTDDNPPAHLRWSFVRRSQYTDPGLAAPAGPARMEITGIITQNRTNGGRVARRLGGLETASGAVSTYSIETRKMLEDQIMTVMQANTASPANFTSQQINENGAAVDASVISDPAADEGPALVFSDLTQTGNITAMDRGYMAVETGHQLKLRVRARLLDAAVVGVDQLTLILAHLQADLQYVDNIPITTSLPVTLSSELQDFELSYTADVTVGPIIRIGVFQPGSYVDLGAGARIEVVDARLINETTGAELLARLNAAEASGQAQRVSGRAMARAAAAGVDPRLVAASKRGDWEEESDQWVTLQPPVNGDICRAKGSKKFKLGDFTTNGRTTIEIQDGETCSFHTEAGNFAGWAGKQLDVDGPALVDVSRARGFYLDAGPATVVPSSPTAPKARQSVLGAGQSNIQNWYLRGGIQGFEEGLRSAAHMSHGAIDGEFHFIRGGTGGTAVLRASKDETGKWWWDPATSTEGTPLTSAKQEMTDAAAIGFQPPETIIWWLGETDAEALESGPVTQAEVQDALETVWAKLREHAISLGAADPQIMVVQIGMSDKDDLLQRRGASRQRAATRDAIEATAYAHWAAAAYDRLAPEDDAHFHGFDYFILGYRLARAWYNVQIETQGVGAFDPSGGAFPKRAEKTAARAGEHWTASASGTIDTMSIASGDVVMCVKDAASTDSDASLWRIVDPADTYDLGPVQDTVSVANAGKSVTYTFIGQTPRMPSDGIPAFGDPEGKGGAPYGFGFVMPDDTLVRITSATIGASSITLHTEKSVSGGVGVFPFGRFPDFRTEDIVIDDQNDERSRVPGLPLQDFMVAVP